ncbi:hypothetical protein [Cohaesibacter gelatinilyticus]|uniref:Hydrolase of the HAD superfamily n=1 Tax=Cohaesibacter gelatinilyticus TaxID=372072 RepID=A0A285NFK7_9HYPH|nr:hypothetical protein [Cohaesibacter gelatinilyticus]SNZ08235.1 hypothetical protein SAMN06265368_1521 [Cohaesibacter gelatinilyticus]
MMTPSELQEQIDPERPLIICDVDEVILHFIRHFEVFLARHDYALKASSYSLNGNIYHRKTGSNLSNNSIKNMINNLFIELSHYQEAVENSISILSSLQKKCNLLLLTNFPEHLADQRRERLAQLGLVAPLLTNQGSKGPKIAQLMEHQKAPAFFLDDSASHISSALDLSLAPICLHFIADARFASIASRSPVTGTALLCRDWLLVQHYIEGYIS